MPNASSWDNGSPDYQTGAGLGLHVYSQYQPTIFNAYFNTIDIYHNGNLIAKDVNVSNKNCAELIDKQIGQWLIMNNLHTWNSGFPHTFTMTQRGTTNVFDIV